MKYHNAGKWSNTCCSHPRPGYSMDEEIHQRLKFVMGIDCELQYGFSFFYKVKFRNCDLYEHEFDHIYTGIYNGEPNPNLEEVNDWKWIEKNQLLLAIKEAPNNFTYWFDKLIQKM